MILNQDFHELCEKSSSPKLKSFFTKNQMESFVYCVGSLIN